MLKSCPSSFRKFKETSFGTQNFSYSFKPIHTLESFCSHNYDKTLKGLWAGLRLHYRTKTAKSPSCSLQKEVSKGQHSLIGACDAPTHMMCSLGNQHMTITCRDIINGKTCRTERPADLGILL